MSRTIIVEHDRFDFFWFFLLVLFVLYIFNLPPFSEAKSSASQQDVAEIVQQDDIRKEMIGQPVILSPYVLQEVNFDGARFCSIFIHAEDVNAEPVLVYSARRPLAEVWVRLHGIVAMNVRADGSRQYYLEKTFFEPAR